jgi:hypothetical protein
MKSKYLLFFSHLASFIRGRIFRLLKRILIIVVLATAIFAAYEYIVIRVEGYPREMHLMDQQYRIIPIHLEKRTTTHLHITRRDTGRFFIYKIEDLHPMSQWQIQLYPITSSGNKEEGEEEEEGDPSWSSSHDRLIEDIKKLRVRIGASESGVEIRSLEREVERKLEKIRKLETSLRTHSVDFDPYEHVEDTEGLVERLSGLLDRIANRDDPSAE